MMKKVRQDNYQSTAVQFKKVPLLFKKRPVTGSYRLGHVLSGERLLLLLTENVKLSFPYGDSVTATSF